MSKMREIEFNAHADGNYVRFDDWKDLQCTYGKTDNELLSEFLNEFFGYNLVQYTGLKDKNVVKVFEGDILFDAHREEYVQVVFNEGCFVAQYSATEEDLAEVLADEDISIAGNIHENPELLEH